MGAWQNQNLDAYKNFIAALQLKEQADSRGMGALMQAGSQIAGTATNFLAQKNTQDLEQQKTGGFQDLINESTMQPVNPSDAQSAAVNNATVGEHMAPTDTTPNLGTPQTTKTTARVFQPGWGTEAVNYLGGQEQNRRNQEEWAQFSNYFENLNGRTPTSADRKAFEDWKFGPDRWHGWSPNEQDKTIPNNMTDLIMQGNAKIFGEQGGGTGKVSMLEKQNAEGNAFYTPDKTKTENKDAWKTAMMRVINADDKLSGWLNGYAKKQGQAPAKVLNDYMEQLWKNEQVAAKTPAEDRQQTVKTRDAFQNALIGEFKKIDQMPPAKRKEAMDKIDAIYPGYEATWGTSSVALYKFLDNLVGGLGTTFTPDETLQANTKLMGDILHALRGSSPVIKKIKIYTSSTAAYGG